MTRTELRGCRHLVGFAIPVEISNNVDNTTHKVSTTSQFGAPNGRAVSPHD